MAPPIVSAQLYRSSSSFNSKSSSSLLSSSSTHSKVVKSKLSCSHRDKKEVCCCCCSCCCYYYWHRPLGSQNNVRRLTVAHRSNICEGTTRTTTTTTTTRITPNKSMSKGSTVVATATWSVPIRTLDLLLNEICQTYQRDDELQLLQTKEQTLEIAGTIEQLSLEKEWIPICTVLSGNRNIKSMPTSVMQLPLSSFSSRYRKNKITSVRWIVESLCHNRHLSTLMMFLQSSIQNLEIIGGSSTKTSVKVHRREQNDWNNDSCHKNETTTTTTTNDEKVNELWNTLKLCNRLTSLTIRHHNGFRDLWNEPSSFDIFLQMIVPKLYKLTITAINTCFHPSLLYQIIADISDSSSMRMTQFQFEQQLLAPLPPHPSSPPTLPLRGAHQSLQTRQQSQLPELSSTESSNSTSSSSGNINNTGTQQPQLISRSKKQTNELHWENQDRETTNLLPLSVMSIPENFQVYMDWNLRLNLVRHGLIAKYGGYRWRKNCRQKYTLTNHRSVAPVSKSSLLTITPTKTPTTMTTPTMVLQSKKSSSSLTSFVNESDDTNYEEIVAVVESACRVLKDWYRATHRPLDLPPPTTTIVDGTK